MKLRIGTAIAEVVGEISAKRAALLQAILVPAILLALSSVLSEINARRIGVAVVTLPIDLLASGLYAVSCHRVLLLGPEELTNPWGLSFSQREVRFIAVSVGISLVASAVVIIAVVAGLVLPIGVDAERVPVLAVFAAMPVVGYITCRLSPLLPATALDLRLGLKQAWSLTRNNGLRVMALAIICAVPQVALAVFFASPALGHAGTVGRVAQATIQCLLWAPVVAAISVAFRTLAEDYEIPLAA